MDKILIVVDMQNDFIDFEKGALGSIPAQNIVPAVVEKVKNFDGRVYFTRDTHYENYSQTLEGEKLPIPHCIKGTWGWEICDELKPYADKIINKDTFGFTDWEYLLRVNLDKKNYAPDEIEICGLCTDICVISNALILRATYPNTKIVINEALCAGSDVVGHVAALKTMERCQIDVIKAF